MSSHLTVSKLITLDFFFALLKSSDKAINVSDINIDINIHVLAMIFIEVTFGFTNRYAVIVFITVNIYFILFSYKSHFNYFLVIQEQFTTLQCALQGGFKASKSSLFQLVKGSGK